MMLSRLGLGVGISGVVLLGAAAGAAAVPRHAVAGAPVAGEAASIQSLAGQLVSTAAVSPNDVWSVGGTDQPGHSNGKTLVEHWNGRSWTRVKSANSPVRR